MAVWPASLPDDVLVDGYSERPPRVRLRTPMDAGPPKMRRRFTAAVEPIRCTMAFTRAQVTTFRTFYDTTLLGGVLTFDWTHPRTLAAVTFRFADPEPEITPNSGKDWIGDFTLEVMP